MAECSRLLGLQQQVRNLEIWWVLGRNQGHTWHTVDGSEILHQLRLVVSPIIYRVLYIPGGAGSLPSTVFRFNLIPWAIPRQLPLSNLYHSRFSKQAPSVFCEEFSQFHCKSVSSQVTCGFLVQVQKHLTRTHAVKPSKVSKRLRLRRKPWTTVKWQSLVFQSYT